MLRDCNISRDKYIARQPIINFHRERLKLNGIAELVGREWKTAGIFAVNQFTRNIPLLHTMAPSYR